MLQKKFTRIIAAHVKYYFNYKKWLVIFKIQFLFKILLIFWCYNLLVVATMKTSVIAAKKFSLTNHLIKYLHTSRYKIVLHTCIYMYNNFLTSKET